MQDIDDKIDNNATADGRLPAAQYNDRNDELKNAVTNSGQTLTPGAGTDVQQLSRSMSGFAAAANVYTDSGGANALVAVENGNFKRPNPASLSNMAIVIIPANDGAAAATTLNYFGIATDRIVDGDDNDPTDQDIKEDRPLSLVFDTTKQGGSGAWVIQGAVADLPTASDTARGTIQIATVAEHNALSSTTKAVVPGRIPAASDTQVGISRRATAAEGLALTNTTAFMTPGRIPAAADAQAGVVRRATAAEGNALSNTTAS